LIAGSSNLYSDLSHMRILENYVMQRICRKLGFELSYLKMFSGARSSCNLTSDFGPIGLASRLAKACRLICLKRNSTNNDKQELDDV